MAAMQYSLLRDDTKSKTIQHVPVKELELSVFNPRRTRTDEQIQGLAERIERNGYEITRALWVYPSNNHYEVFAGGTRLEAVKHTSLQEVPVVVHEGYSDDEITRLADEDNENDEYHAPVSVVDKWLDYARLYELWKDEGGQMRVAKAKGHVNGKGQPDNAPVSRYLTYAKFPRTVLDVFMKNDFLKDGHAAEISKICNFHNSDAWLNTETAMLYVMRRVLGRSNTPTAKDFKSEVDRLNKAIDRAMTAIDTLGKVTLYMPPEFGAYEYDATAKFLAELNKANARTDREVQTVEHQVRTIIADNLKEYEQHLATKTAEAEDAAKTAEVEELPFTLLEGDFRQVGKDIPDNSIDFIFTDPPYDEKSIPLYGDLAKLAARVLKPGGSLITYAGHYAIPDVLPLMQEHLRYWWICALEHSGNSARLPGKWVYVEWKPLLWFVKDNRRDDEYVADRFRSTPTDKQLHKWQQDVSEARYYIERLTSPGDVILDPFMGSATTGIAALSIDRQFIGVEQDAAKFFVAEERLNNARHEIS